MNIRFTALLLSLMGLTGFSCGKSSLKEKQQPGCYKGRLEVKGICRNYTIKIIEGNIDPSLVEGSWTDPSTGITHTNVFALASICDFPDDIEAGAEFYFRINNHPTATCAVCEAYYPTPQKRLAISVSEVPCLQAGKPAK